MDLKDEELEEWPHQADAESWSRQVSNWEFNDSVLQCSSQVTLGIVSARKTCGKVDQNLVIGLHEVLSTSPLISLSDQHKTRLS